MAESEQNIVIIGQIGDKYQEIAEDLMIQRNLDPGTFWSEVLQKGIECMAGESGIEIVDFGGLFLDEQTRERIRVLQSERNLNTAQIMRLIVSNGISALENNSMNQYGVLLEPHTVHDLSWTSHSLRSLPHELDIREN